jgi:hypothetical protein
MNDETMRDSLWIPFSAVQKPLNAVVAVLANRSIQGFLRWQKEAKRKSDNIKLTPRVTRIQDRYYAYAS